MGNKLHTHLCSLMIANRHRILTNCYYLFLLLPSFKSNIGSHIAILYTKQTLIFDTIMKKPLFTFLFVFILLGGMHSSADNAQVGLLPPPRFEAVIPPIAVDGATDPSSTKPLSGSVTVILMATGLIGLAGVSRRSNS